VSILVSAVVVGCGVLVGRLLAQSPRVGKHRRPSTPATEPPAAVPATPPAPASLDGFPCQLGDVVLRSIGDEAWLAGALVLSEDSAPAAVLFFSPEAGGMRAVLAKPQREDLVWLGSAADVVVVGGEPATSLEIAGERFERRRRLPLRVERRGTGAPDMGTEVIFAEYTGLGESQLVVLAGKDKTLALRGESLPHGTFDVLPGKE
jgi:hypothetical protein